VVAAVMCVSWKADEEDVSMPHMMNDRQNLYLILDSTIEAESRQTLRGIKENCSLWYR